MIPIGETLSGCAQTRGGGGGGGGGGATGAGFFSSQVAKIDRYYLSCNLRFLDTL